MRALKIGNQITNRDALSLEKYLQDIGKIDLLTPEEEIDLSKKIKEGDKQAFQTLIRANLRFVVSVAKKYQNQGLSLGDLINEGNAGVIRAATDFDATKGFKFISYAVRWIRQSILSALAENSKQIRLPLNKVADKLKLNNAIEAFEQEEARSPEIRELEALTDITAKNITDILQGSQPLDSFDRPIGDDHEHTLGELISGKDEIGPDHELLQESRKQTVIQVLNTLTERQAEVIKLYFGIGVERTFSLEEIGDLFGLTRERVRQIKDRAIGKLRNSHDKFNALKSV